MTDISQVIVLFIVLCYVYLSRGQHDNWHEANYHYNFPNLIESIGSRMSVSQDRKHENSYVYVLSLLKVLTNFNPAFDKILKEIDNIPCRQDIEYLKKTLRSKDMWGIKMLDAFGKPGSGFLEGNSKWLGNYHECTNVHVPLSEDGTAGDFKGQYCTVDLTVAILNRPIPFTVGICLPDSCETEVTQYKDIFSLKNPMQSLFNITLLTCQPTSKKISSAAIGMTFLLSAFVLLALIGSSMTAYEYFSESSIAKNTHQSPDEEVKAQMNGNLRQPDKCSSSDDCVTLIPDTNQTIVIGLYAKLKPYFSCFCVFTNGEELLNTDDTEGQFLCLHGIRFLSMCWVIACHTYAICFASFGNMIETISLMDNWPFQIILNGFFSVDTFFLLSGFLVAYLFFKKISKSNGKYDWIEFYVHRYIRLTPVYMIALGINTTLYFYMGSGPRWTTNEVDPVCRDYWWYNILYINNLVPTAKQCMGWSWYLANDMQFFVITPLFLITLWRWPPIGFSLLGIFWTATFAVNFGCVYYYDLFTGTGNIVSLAADLGQFVRRFAIFFEKLYIKPYSRSSPYLIGIALAYYVFRRKQNKRGKVNLITLCCGWIVASAVTLTCIFCLYHHTLTKVENSFYNAVKHTCFAGGVGWVIFTCLNGQGGPVNSILSFKLFIPLSRLSYCAYLIHPIILLGYFDALKVPLHFSHITLVTTFLGLLMITYVSAFLLSVLYEYPILKLDKLVRTKFRGHVNHDKKHKR